MHADLLTVSSRLAGLPTLDACLDAVQASAGHLGCKALIYDYAPVPLSHDGVLITPSVFKVRNAPADMQAFWCERGYYQIDPVQQCASRRAAPFVWSFAAKPAAPCASTWVTVIARSPAMCATAAWPPG